MRYCRFRLRDAHHGLIESVAGRDMITRTFEWECGGDQAVDEVASRKIDPVPLDEANLLAPVTPTKIICVGRNYREHARELGHEVPVELLIFSKPPSAVIAPGEGIVRPSISQRVDHEGELGVVIGKRARLLGEDEDVREYIAGYSCVNDVTARDLQQKDNQWTRAKGFDTFCPVGPIVTDEIDPWAGVQVQTRVNGELKQDGNTRDFLFDLGAIIRYISRVMTLLPGDWIATGTPAGVGPVKHGDVVEVTVEGVGTLSNPVLDE